MTTRGSRRRRSGVRPGPASGSLILARSDHYERAAKELSLDILTHILTRPELRHVVLVGGDRDYLPILRRIKEQHLGLHVCSLKACLSGDVREFVGNYPQATVIELDVLFEPAKYRPQPPVARPAPVSRPDNAGPALAPQTFDPDAISEWHERYLP